MCVQNTLYHKESLIYLVLLFVPSIWRRESSKEVSLSNPAYCRFACTSYNAKIQEQRRKDFEKEKQICKQMQLTHYCYTIIHDHPYASQGKGSYVYMHKEQGKELNTNEEQGEELDAHKELGWNNRITADQCAKYSSGSCKEIL